MAKYYVAFMGTDKKRNTIVSNELVMMDSRELSMEDINEIKDCIAFRYKLQSVAILNIMTIK